MGTMALCDIVVHLDNTAAAARRLDAAVALARRLGARLKGVFALSNPDGSNLASTLRPRIAEQAAGVAEALFRQRTAAAGLEANWTGEREAGERNVVHAVVRAARTADLVILGQFEAEAADGTVPADLVEQTVAIAGRPVLVVPFAGSFPVIGRRVIVAWNNSREAARALADAMVLLATAQEVGVLVLAPQGRGGAGSAVSSAEAVLDHLAQHGINATADRLSFDARGIDPAERLLSHLADVGADLLVMGAAGQSLRRSPRQSLTPGMLAQMTVPVLLSS